MSVFYNIGKFVMAAGVTSGFDARYQDDSLTRHHSLYSHIYASIVYSDNSWRFYVFSCVIVYLFHVVYFSLHVVNRVYGSEIRDAVNETIEYKDYNRKTQPQSKL